jgi:hypothetical protein
MTEEDFSFGGFDPYSLIAPTISPATSDAANAIPAKPIPVGGSVGLDVLARNRAQAKSEHSHLQHHRAAIPSQAALAGQTMPSIGRIHLKERR